MAATKTATGKTVTVELYASAIRRPERQVETLKGLGLTKMNRQRTLVDSPALRGMLRKVAHMVRVVPDKAAK